MGARVSVTARRPEAAAAVASLAAQSGARRSEGARPRVIVNATPLGMHGEALPEVYMDLTADQVALDLVYGDEVTPFVASARDSGALALDGRGLLVAQAAGSFERWTGRPAPVEVMAEAVHR
jgi:shikimate dehydrogenase